ncbi:hypothetical protein BJX99DRAFT_257646 [Aspergillus californicus]
MGSNLFPEKPSPKPSPSNSEHGVEPVSGYPSYLKDLVEPGLIGTPSNLSVNEADRSRIAYFGIKDQWFKGPNGSPYTSIGVLDPLITVERHHGKYHITARFNIETTILDYNMHKKDGHQLFFQDICLQYLSATGDEDLVTEPKSDPTGAFTVTRMSNTTLSGNAGLSLSNVPSANISLGISRSRECTVEHTINSWSVSAHRMFPETRKRRRRLDVPQYQWFWAANAREIATLTPDLTHTVKRHVLVKRVVPIAGFPVERLQAARSVLRARTWEDKAQTHNAPPHEVESARESLFRHQEEAWGTSLADWKNTRDRRHVPLEQMLEFRFCILIRLRRRYGRLHRAFLFSSNENKAKLVEPSFREKFSIRVPFGKYPGPPPSQSSLGYSRGRPRDFPSDEYLTNLTRIPLADTYNLRDVLVKIKSKYEGNWDELQSKDWVDLVQDETGTEVQETDVTADAFADTTVEATAEATAEAAADMEAVADIFHGHVCR